MTHIASNHDACYTNPLQQRQFAKHDQRLKAALNMMKSKGLKLNKVKCLFHQEELSCIGSLVGRSGVKPDPDRVEAIVKMPPPENVTDQHWVIGMINYLGKSVPGLSTIMKQMSDLLNSDAVWYWQPLQEQAYTELKEKISTSPVLAFYDPYKPSTVSADANCISLGAVLLQQEGDRLVPVTYSSRTPPSRKSDVLELNKSYWLACGLATSSTSTLWDWKPSPYRRITNRWSVWSRRRTLTRPQSDVKCLLMKLKDLGILKEIISWAR